MKLDQMKDALRSEQNAFKLLVTKPNTLERNLGLAEHRTEIARLEKLIAKQDRSQ